MQTIFFVASTSKHLSKKLLIHQKCTQHIATDTLSPRFDTPIISFSIFFEFEKIDFCIFFKILLFCLQSEKSTISAEGPVLGVLKVFDLRTRFGQNFFLFDMYLWRFQPFQVIPDDFSRRIFVVSSKTMLLQQSKRDFSYILFKNSKFHVSARQQLLLIFFLYLRKKIFKKSTTS